jgi:fatty acid desaturase
VKTQRDYSLMGPESARAVERGLSRAQWYQTPVDRKDIKQLMKRTDGPAIRDTAIWLGLMVLFGYLGVRTWFSAWSILWFALYGVLYGSASDSRWHECGHGTAFKTRWMNTAVYNIASFMIVRNPVAWRWSHTRHHTDTYIVGRDPEIVAMRPPNFGRLAANFVGIFDSIDGWKSMLRNAAGKLSPNETQYVPVTELKKVTLVARVWVLIYALTIGLAVATTSVLPLMLIGLPRLFGAWHHVLTGLTQHCGLAEDVVDHRLNTRSVLLNPISRFVYWNMNYHLEHHMFPMVPYHALPKLHELLKDDVPEISPSLLAAYREFLPVLWNQRKEPTKNIVRTLPTSAAS